MACIRGGLCRNLCGVTERMDTDVPDEQAKASPSKVIELWNSACLCFIQNSDFYPLMERADKALIRAGFGEHSSQEFIVHKFWETVNRSKEGSFLVRRADELVSCLEQDIKKDPFIRLVSILFCNSKEILEAFYCFKSRTLPCILQKHALPNDEKIVLDYVECQTNIWVVSQACASLSDQLFNPVQDEKQKSIQITEKCSDIGRRFKLNIEEVQSVQSALEKKSPNVEQLKQKIISLRSDLGEIQKDLQQDFLGLKKKREYAEIEVLFQQKFRQQVKLWQEKVVSQYQALTSSEDQNFILDDFLWLIQDGLEDQTDRFEQFSEETTLTVDKMRMVKQEMVTKLRRKAFALYVQDPGNCFLIERGEKAFVKACFGKSSAQELTVTKFWELVKNPLGGSSLLLRIEHMNAYILFIMKALILKHKQEILNSLESDGKEIKIISYVVDSLYKEFYVRLGIKQRYASEEEKIMHDYALFRLNILLAIFMVEYAPDECVAEKIFHALAVERQEQRKDHKKALTFFLERSIEMDEDRLLLIEEELKKAEGDSRKALEEAQSFFLEQLRAAIVRRDNVDNEVLKVGVDSEVIKAFQSKQAPFFKSIKLWRQNLVDLYKKLFALDDPNSMRAFFPQMFRQNFEKEAEVFELLAAQE